MSQRYLLDTSVYSQPLRGHPVMAALQRWCQVGDSACAVSVVSIAEVEYGLALEARPERFEKYTSILQGRLNVIETDAMVWSQFALRKARQQILGQQISDLDLLIASCAACHQLTVATLNTRDLSRLEGVRLSRLLGSIDGAPFASEGVDSIVNHGQWVDVVCVEEV